MAALVAAIHDFTTSRKDVDARIKSARDDFFACSPPYPHYNVTRIFEMQG